MSRAASVCPRIAWPSVNASVNCPREPLQEPLHAAARELDDAAADAGAAPRAKADKADEKAEQRVRGSPEHGEKAKGYGAEVGHGLTPLSGDTTNVSHTAPGHKPSHDVSNQPEWFGAPHSNHHHQQRNACG